MSSFMFRALAKLVTGSIDLIKRLFFGGEKKEIEEDEEMKAIFGDDAMMAGEMEVSDKIFYRAMMNTVKRSLANLDDSFLKVVDNMSDNEFEMLVKKLETDVKAESGSTSLLFDRMRGDFTDEGKRFIENKLFGNILPPEMMEELQRKKGIAGEDIEVHDKITSDEVFQDVEFLMYLKNEYGLSETVAPKSLSPEEFEKIKEMYKLRKPEEGDTGEGTDGEKSDTKKNEDAKYRTVIDKSSDLIKFIQEEYGISYGIYKDLKPEELEIINKRYLNFLSDKKAFPG